jgi:hypothetical protein
LLLLTSIAGYAQEPIIRGITDRAKQLGGMRTQSGGNDSLKKRDRFADSVTVRFRYLDSTRSYTLDSSVADFTIRFPIPATNIYLGNTGLASRSILFTPQFNAGWDAGFHALDIYRWKTDRIRFFNSTRPYSELNYQLASRSEQVIEILHTQNIKPNWNFLFQYRMINSPGFFKNQKSNHNNYLLTSWYQSVNKRYNNYFAIIGNKLQASENGGIQDTFDFMNSPIYKDRFNIYTKIGGDSPFGTDFFSTRIGTGTKYSDFTLLLRQQYDFGKKDSIVTDSTVIPLFYPRLRFEHTLTYSTYKYTFSDAAYVSSTGYSYVPDSAYYADTYGLTITPGDSVYHRDRWKEVINDFSIYQFPDAKNQQQFIKLGAAVQNLSGEFASGKKNYYNVFGHAEYRNKTRDLKWDIEANGKLYFTGLNAGDYQAYASLQRFVGKKIGYVQLGFGNVNRTPSFIFDQRSSFYMDAAKDFKKENSTQLFASFFQPQSRLRLTGRYYLLTNYTYVTNYYQLEQSDGLFNVLQIALQKTIRVGKHWNWHADIYFQQAVGDAPVNMPLIFTRNRFAYEGDLGFKNLSIAFGLEAKYHTPYKADGYSPALGQFFYQDSITIRNKLPDIAAYVHFRIKGFKAYVRAENLNTASTKVDGFGFTNNNVAAPGYPYPGLLIRFGIYWSFVN